MSENKTAQYLEWIANYPDSIHRRCVQVTEAMQAQFPELIICRGLVTIEENCREYQHQWLRTVDGEVVDPTAQQWLGIIEYEEITDPQQEPVGKCMWCGGWVRRNRGGLFCSDYCENQGM